MMTMKWLNINLQANQLFRACNTNTITFQTFQANKSEQYENVFSMITSLLKYAHRFPHVMQNLTYNFVNSNSLEEN